MTVQSAPRRRSRVEQKEQRTRELLDAAWALFNEKGYEAVTIDEVADRAGYSRMPIYTLFGDKQNLYFELWRLAVGQLEQNLFGDRKPGDPLRTVLRKLANRVVSNPPAPAPQRSGESLFVVVQTIALSRPDIAEKLRELSRQVIDDVAEIVRTSPLEPGDTLHGTPATVAAYLVAQINGLAMVQFQTGTRYASARFLESVFLAIALKD